MQYIQLRDQRDISEKLKHCSIQFSLFTVKNMTAGSFGLKFTDHMYLPASSHV